MTTNDDIIKSLSKDRQERINNLVKEDIASGAVQEQTVVEKLLLRVKF